MCGIAGWKLTDKAPDTFYLYLAYCMEARGGESYGFFDGAEVYKGEWEIVKNLPIKTLATREGFLHTRFGTTGANTVENAHPFAIGKMIGAHNGTLSNHLAMNLIHKRTCAVDSMHIFEHLASGLPLTELQGYGAIEYFDGAWYVGCCNGGELEVAKTNLGLVWASTREAVTLACENAGLTIEHFYIVEEGKQYRVESDCLYQTDRVFNLSKPPIVIDWKKGREGAQSIASGGGLATSLAGFDGRTEWERELDAREGTEGGVFHSSISTEEWRADSGILRDLQVIIEDDSLRIEEHVAACDAMDMALEGDFTLANDILEDYYGADYGLYVEESAEDDLTPDFSKPVTMQAVCEWCGEERKCVESFGAILCGDCIKICN